MIINDINLLELIATAVTFFTAIILGLTVYLRNPKSWTNRLFFLLTLVISVYTIINFFSIHPPSLEPQTHLFFIRLTMFVGAFLGPLLFLLVYTFPGKGFTLKGRYLTLLLVLTSAAAIFSLTPFVFESLYYPETGNPVPVAGPGIALYFLNFVGLILLSFATLIVKYNRSTGEEKLRHLYLLLGILLSFSIMVVVTIIFVIILKTSVLIFLGPTSTIILAAFIAYAIVRHKFLDIQPIIVRAVSSALIIGLFALAYAFVIIFGIQRALSVQINPLSFTVLLFLGLVAMLTFHPLTMVFRRFTNRIFFKGRYDSDKLISQLTHVMASTIDIDSLTSQILKKLIKEMSLTKGAFLIVSSHKIADVKSVGYEDYEVNSAELEGLLHKKSTLNPPFLLEDLREGPMKEVFRKTDISVAIPIKVEKEEVAILVLGPKLSGEAYRKRDIDFLDTFSSGAGIAIQNAKSYAEIKKFADVLEAKVVERTAELEKTQKSELQKAQEVARLKDEFVFIAAHELRTPVTVIKGFLELVSEATENFPKDVREHLEAISSASDHLNQLVSDLLEVARSEAGGAKVEVAPLDIIPLVDDLMKEFAPIAKEKGVTLAWTTDRKAAIALGNKKRLEEVFMNIISNGIKYNRKNGRIDISVFPQGDNIMLEFKDTGYGIPKDQQDEIFQKFFRAHSKETQEVLGTGLGLFITRMLVEKMGGKITFSSLEGKGTTFAILLPKADKN